MGADIKSIEDYIENLPEDRKMTINKLRQVVKDNLPTGFSEEINYGMIGYVVPHSIYPGGYHCDPKLPLPFINIASQKNFISLYHMGLYSDKEMLDWFTKEYASRVKTRLDIGKSCIRFKKPEHIPYDLIGELAKKLSPQDWIELYERELKKK
jgi:uncharacterized protein YdhG (YjbR/CyaY superfamily)